YTTAFRFSAPGSVNEPDAVYVSPAWSDAPLMAATTGATLFTWTDDVITSVSPSLSVTVSVTVKSPSCAYVCDVVEPVPVVPSPKFHANDVIVPLGSLDAAALMFTALPSEPVYGPSSAAIGGLVLLSTAASILSGNNDSKS